MFLEEEKDKLQISNLNIIRLDHDDSIISVLKVGDPTQFQV
jgi:hypothetical protein